MEDFYIGGASVKLFLPIFKMNFPEIVDLALPAEGVFHNLVWSGVAHAPSRVVFGALAKHLFESSFGSQIQSARAPTGAADGGCAPYKIMRGLWGMGADDVHHIHRGQCVRTQTPSAIQFSQKGDPWPPLITMDAAVWRKIDAVFKL